MFGTQAHINESSLLLYSSQAIELELPDISVDVHLTLDKLVGQSWETPLRRFSIGLKAFSFTRSELVQKPRAFNWT